MIVTTPPPAIRLETGLRRSRRAAPRRLNLSAGLVELGPSAGGDDDVDNAQGTAGEVAVIEVVELTRYWVAAVEPKLTPLTPLNPAPVT